MAIALEERFEVDAPPGPVWDLLFDPRRVVTCVPGGELTALLDDQTFDGRLRVEVGFLRFSYGGRLRIADADPVARRVRIVGGAHERDGSGTARLTLVSRLEPLEGGATVVVVLAHVEVGGRVAELGRGLLQRLAHEVFQDFAGHVRAALAPPAGARRGGAAARQRVPGGGTAADGARGPALHALPIAARALRRWVGGWWRGRLPLPAR
jgi:carbon monoxide dehydrogenase subunit G